MASSIDSLNPIISGANGQAERMVRPIKVATAKAFRYTSISKLRHYVRDGLMAYTVAKQLKVLRFKTPYEALETPEIQIRNL